MHLLSRTSRTFVTMLALSLPLSSAASQVTVFSTILHGTNVLPGTPSLGSGLAVVTLDEMLRTLRVQFDFSGLTGTTISAHLHCCVAWPENVGVASPTPTFPFSPLGGNSGFYDNTFDMTLATSYNNAFIVANGGTTLSAFAALAEGLHAGEAYFDIHTSAYPGGEIRGLLPASRVPEPGTGGLVVAGMALFLALTRARRWGYSQSAPGGTTL